MKVVTSVFTFPRQEFTRRKAAWLFFLLANFVFGCTVLENSASFYKDQPRRPINWREYTSD